MARRYFNWALLIVVVVAAAVLVISAFALRNWQKNVRAERALPLGEAAYEQGDWDQAAGQYYRYIQVNSDRIDIKLKYAEAQLNRRPATNANVESARSTYAQILRDQQAEPELAKEAAVALIELDLGYREFLEAVETARRYLAANDDPTVRRLLGLGLAGQEEWAEAAQVFSGLIEDDPNNVLAYAAMGSLAENHPTDVNRPANAWFDEAIQRNPNSAQAYVIRAEFRLRHSDPNAAIADLQRALTLDLSDPQVRLRLAASLANADRLDQAREQLKILQDEVPDESNLYQLWAMIALMTDDKEEMATVAQAGLEGLEKQPLDFMPVAVELYIRAGKLEEANDCLTRMQERNVRPDVVAYLQGRVAYDQGHVQTAINHWVDAIGLGYNDFLSFSFSSLPVRMALAVAYEQLGDLRSAISQMRSFIADMSNLGNDALRLRGDLALGRLLIRAEDWSGAMDAARAALTLDPSSTEATEMQLQARINQMLAGGVASDAPAWQDVEMQLNALEQRDENSLVVGLLRVQAAMGRGLFEDAENLLDELDNRYPDEVTLAQRRATLYLIEAARLRDEDRTQEADATEQEAVDVLRKAVDAFPQNTEPVLYLARLLSTENRTQESESVILEAMERISRPQERRRLGLWLAAAYDAWDADEKRGYKWLQDLAQQYPADILIKRRLLSLQTVVDDPAKAQALVDDIKEIEGEDGWQWRLEQAKVWLQQIYSGGSSGRYAEIVGLLQQNLEANPEDTASRLLLGQAYDNPGEQPQLALKMYEEALAREPDNAVIVARTASALIRAGRRDEAERIIKEAEQRNLYHPDFRNIRLSAELDRGNTSSDSPERLAALSNASDILEEMLADDPNNDSAAVRLALLLGQQERFEEAQAVIDGLKRSDPDAIYTREVQIQLYIQQKDVQKALDASDEMVTQLNSALAYAMRAQTYTAFNRPDEALDDLTHAIELEPKTPAWWLTRARFFRSFGKTGQAVSDARQALALAPDSLNAQRLLAGLLIDAGSRSDLGEAQGILDAALADNPQDAGLTLLHAKLLLNTQTTTSDQEARRVLRALTRSHPENAEAWTLLGRLELGLGNAGTAISLAIQGLDRVPDNAALLLLKADAEYEGSPAVAIPTLQKLAGMFPQSIDVVQRLARAYVGSGDSAAALDLIDKTLAGLEGDARLFAEMSLTPEMYRAGEQAKAKRFLAELSRTRPDDRDPIVLQAQLFAIEQNWDGIRQLVNDWCAAHTDDVQTPELIARGLMANGAEGATQLAEEILQSALLKAPDTISLMHPLAMLIQASGRGAESAELNRRILDLDPNDVIAANNLAWYLAEDLGQSDEALEEALKLANDGLALVPGYTDLRDTRGMIYYHMGRYADAAADFATCVRQYAQNDPSLTGSQFHLGRTYVALGDRENARDELKQALELQEEIGGLTREDLADAHNLLDQLEEDQQ